MTNTVAYLTYKKALKPLTDYYVLNKLECLSLTGLSSLV
jgi:hypothetical protein